MRYLLIVLVLFACKKKPVEPQNNFEVYTVNLHFSDSAYLNNSSIRINHNSPVYHYGDPIPGGGWLNVKKWDTTIIVHTRDSVTYQAVTNSTDKNHIPTITIDYKGRTDQATRYANGTARGISVMP